MTVFHRAPRSVMPQKYFQSLAGFYRLGCASVGAKNQIQGIKWDRVEFPYDSR